MKALACLRVVGLISSGITARLPLGSFDLLGVTVVEHFFDLLGEVFNHILGQLPTEVSI